MADCKEVQKRFNNCNVGRLLGIEVYEVEKGRALGRMEIKKDHINIFGGIHGGILFTFADHIGGACGNSMDYTAVLLRSTGRFKKSAKEGEVLHAEARIVHSRKKMDRIDIEVTKGNGETVAAFRMLSYIMDNAAKTP